MDRTYSDAVRALNSLQSNASVVNAIRLSGGKMNTQAISEMIEWCRKIGYEPSDFNRLNAIHIAGTKGKGSTSAFISSILAQYLPSLAEVGRLGKLHKIGLYTSPHLRFVRERIQIDNAPLSEAAFASYFFQTWDRLEASAAAAGEPTNPCAKPVYFRFLTLMALHTYMSEGVDTAVIECGIGGEYDSTNILVRPTFTGITNLGIDHTIVLGKTIEEIAWHKAGIMKQNTVCYTVQQPEPAMAVLRERATKRGSELRLVAERHPEIVSGEVALGLAADFQKTNASLAIEIAAEHLRVLGYKGLNVKDKLPEEFVKGLEQVKWGGRCETRLEGPIGWHLDGGHTLESITVAGEWYAKCVLASHISPPVNSSKESALSTSAAAKASPPRILLFNQQTRAGLPLLRTLHTLLSNQLQHGHPFSHVIVCSNVTFADSGFRPDLVSINVSEEELADLRVQKELAQGWESIDGQSSEVFVVRTIEDAVEKARLIAGTWMGGDAQRGGPIAEGHIKVLVTGSVHLVGGVLEVLAAED
ncbi:Folylpolyglutamate synthetase [Xylographa opegraphella]|nr:Folylpolyglutamate synthetase [Xylographa opegraphella]